jgi:hypothetical protein
LIRDNSDGDKDFCVGDKDLCIEESIDTYWGPSVSLPGTN